MLYSNKFGKETNQPPTEVPSNPPTASISKTVQWEYATPDALLSMHLDFTSIDLDVREMSTSLLSFLSQTSSEQPNSQLPPIQSWQLTYLTPAFAY
jgi:hypothetical protein